MTSCRQTNVNKCAWTLLSPSEAPGCFYLNVSTSTLVNNVGRSLQSSNTVHVVNSVGYVTAIAIKNCFL